MSKHFVIQARLEEGSTERKSLGTREEILASLAGYNTMPEKEGDDMLWGPGIRIELPPTEGDVQQMLLHIVEDEIAWYPIVRLARQFNWSVTDIETGQPLFQR
tara:strand:+ start:866 stop:1174 length:309 start_codon:yes stop_codon:yes gene_type:complete